MSLKNNGGWPIVGVCQDSSQSDQQVLKDFLITITITVTMTVTKATMATIITILPLVTNSTIYYYCRFLETASSVIKTAVPRLQTDLEKKTPDKMRIICGFCRGVDGFYVGGSEFQDLLSDLGRSFGTNSMPPQVPPKFSLGIG